jgi:hypothetical protein
MTQSKVEIPGGSFSPQATDGHRMVYRDDATGELIYSDVATKTRRVIFKPKPDDVTHWMPSRDFSMVALEFERKPNRPAFVALVQIDGKGYRELVRIGMDVGIVNWSWDNHYLLVASPETGPFKRISPQAARFRSRSPRPWRQPIDHAPGVDHSQESS